MPAQRDLIEDYGSPKWLNWNYLLKNGETLISSNKMNECLLQTRIEYNKTFNFFLFICLYANIRGWQQQH